MDQKLTLEVQLNSMIVELENIFENKKVELGEIEILKPDTSALLTYRANEIAGFKLAAHSAIKRDGHNRFMWQVNIDGFMKDFNEYSKRISEINPSKR